MSHHRKLPTRERVFVHSLMYHGYRSVQRRFNLKQNRGYVIPATKHEDSTGTDFWIKPRGWSIMVPVQVTQRGIALYKKWHPPSREKLEDFIKVSDKRIRQKRQRCARHKILFVLVRDYDGKRTNPTLAWGDIKALRYALKRFKH